MDERLPDLSAYGLKLVEELGTGGTSIVYKAIQQNVGDREVAVKIPKPQFFDALDILRREITAITRLRHPNIVVVFDAGLGKQPPYLVVELAASTGPQVELSEYQCLTYGIKLCSALSAAHVAGVTHGDIKPQNILWNGSEPLLSDFGTAVLNTKTLYRDPVGYTPEWMAPWHLQHPGDPNSDVWSTAAVVLFWLTGQLPHDFDWATVPEGLAAALRPSMKTDYRLVPRSIDPALDLGRRLQQRQFQLSKTFTPFPTSSQQNWIPGETQQPPDEPPHNQTAPTEEVTRPAPEVVQRTLVQPPHQPYPVLGRRRSKTLMFVGVVIVIALSVGVGGWILNSGGQDAGVDSSGTTSTAAGRATSASAATKPSVSDNADGGSGGKDVAQPTGTSELTNDLAFATDQGGNYDILLRRTDGQTGVIVSTPNADTEPALSPDSTKVAFTSDKDGSHAVYLAPTDRSAEPTLLSTKGAEAESPAWSPDGKSLVWSARDKGNWDIIKYDFSTGNTTRIVADLTDDRHPSWSSDGSTIVFRSDRTGNGDIYSFNVNNQQVKQLSSDAALEDHPSMGPDQQLAFERWINGKAQLFSRAKDDSEPTRVTEALDWEGAPAWVSSVLVAVLRSADGSKIVADFGNGNTVIYESAGFITGLVAASGAPRS